MAPTRYLAALAIVAAACGSDRGKTRARKQTRAAAAPSAPADEEASSGGDGKFGTLDSPCGEGDATGATDQGVTDDQITIGYGDDAGFASVARPQPRDDRRHRRP